MEVNGTLGVPFCGELYTRRRREKNPYGSAGPEMMNNFYARAEWNCTNRTWCEQNFTTEEGGWSLPNCAAMDGEVSLCGACPGCMVPCPLHEPTTTTTARPLLPAISGWAFVPVEQMMRRFCDIDALAPICIFFLLYLIRCYACSLIAGISKIQNHSKQERQRMEHRKRSRELGVTVEEMQRQKKKKKKKHATAVEVPQQRVVEIEPAPPSKGEVKGGRIFGV